MNKIILILLIATNCHAQNFENYAFQAQVIEVFFGVPASIQLAQGYCETNFGAPDPGGKLCTINGKKVLVHSDTIGNHFNNIFAIMDFEGDYWTFGNGKAFGCWFKRRYTWRKYQHQLLSWLDHAYYLILHNPDHWHKPWQYWCNNPVKYGRQGYWKKIKSTITKYNLGKYDVF